MCTKWNWRFKSKSLFNMITAENESKTLTGHILCKCICKFNRSEYNSDQWWNNNKCQCECKKHHVCEKKLYLESCYL